MAAGCLLSGYWRFGSICLPRILDGILRRIWGLQISSGVLLPAQRAVRSILCAWAAVYRSYTRAGEPFWRREPKLTISLEEILPRVHRKFEEQIRVLFSSKTIINYCIILLMHRRIIFITNAECNYYIIILINASSRKAIRKKMCK
jgi:hypothetical protein